MQDAIEKGSFFDYSRILENGNLSEAFEKSDYVIEGEMKIGGQEHFYMETQCACVVPKGEDGEFEVFCGTQNPSAVPVRSLVFILHMFLYILPKEQSVNAL